MYAVSAKRYGRWLARLLIITKPSCVNLGQGRIKLAQNVSLGKRARKTVQLTEDLTMNDPVSQNFEGAACLQAYGSVQADVGPTFAHRVRLLLGQLTKPVL